jgi:acetyl-CoA carboxylase biotin carboxylase subunit
VLKVLKKILVANRGEIAVRIIRACRELGVRSVAIYSEADRSSLHVRYADEAYCVGPAPARESYLRVERILEVARRSRADAVHPGYGFLAENAEFAQACLDAGLIFVGPSPATLSLAGNKISARRAMREAGLPVIQGTEWSVPAGDLGQMAEVIGYPLLIKAAAGGGGKGIRLVTSPSELPRALVAAHHEAEAAFGDGTLFLERVLQGVRHVEFQILADQYGNVIHLGEREGSIQRHHQKLLEEAPSRALDESLRRRMGEVAIAAARAAGYTNAGTIEFLLDEDGKFYFLEINPRLQVEHPTTEMVTGVDIVKEQLRIASGRRLRYNQDDIHLRGWAIECRILAENPYDNYLPSVGKIIYMREPSGPGVRVDSGIHEGLEVTPYYDSLIAKVITWGETRAEAILRMRRALEEYRIMGIRTNIALHQQILDDARFLGGQVNTTFLEQSGFAEEVAPADELRAAAVLATLLYRRPRAQSSRATVMPTGGSTNWKRFGRWWAIQQQHIK